MPMSESQNNYAEWKKLDKKVHNVWFHLHKAKLLMQSIVATISDCLGMRLKTDQGGVGVRDSGGVGVRDSEGALRNH